jgi:hypothetical protein
MTVTATASPSKKYPASPSEVLDSASTDLKALATTLAEDDVKSCVTPALQTPTPGESALAAEWRSREILLSTSQDHWSNDLKIEITSCQEIKEEVGIEVPAEVPTQRPFPVEYLITFLLLLVEFTTIRTPVVETLGLTKSSSESILIPAMLAICSFLFAHQFGTQVLKSKESNSRKEKNSANWGAALAAVAVASIGVSAVFARLYNAAVISQTKGVETSVVADCFYWLFQFIFIVAALGLSHSYSARVSKARSLGHKSYLSSTAKLGSLLEMQLAQLPQEFERQSLLLGNHCQESLRAYRQALSELAKTPETRAAWSLRNRSFKTEYIPDSVTSDSQFRSNEIFTAAPNAPEGDSENLTTPEPDSELKKEDLFRSITQPANDPTITNNKEQ